MRGTVDEQGEHVANASVTRLSTTPCTVLHYSITPLQCHLPHPLPALIPLPISGWLEALRMIGRKVAITLNEKLGPTSTNGLLMSKGQLVLKFA